MHQIKIFLTKTYKLKVNRTLKETHLFLKFTKIIIIFTGTLIPPVYAESINIIVDAGAQEVIPMNELKIGYLITGSITVSGGGNEIKFWVIDPDGNQVINLGIVIRGKNFEFTTPKNGVYYLRLDNRESMAPKNVIISYEAQMDNTTLDPYLWEKIILLILIIFSVLLYWRRRKRTQNNGIHINLTGPNDDSQTHR